MSGRSLPGKRAFGKNAGISGGNFLAFGFFWEFGSGFCVRFI
jgi:hypothetical protein